MPATGLVIARDQLCPPEAYRFVSWKMVVTPSPVPISVPLVLDQASVLAEGKQQAGSAADISLPAAVVIPAGETFVVVGKVTEAD